MEKENSDEKENHKKLFEEFLNKYSKDDTTSYVMLNEKRNLIIKYLNNQIEKKDPKLSHQIKQKKYNIVVIDNSPILHRRIPGKIYWIIKIL